MCSYPFSLQGHTTVALQDLGILCYSLHGTFLDLRCGMCFCSNLFNKSLCTVALSASINKDDVSWCVVQPEHAHALQHCLQSFLGTKTGAGSSSLPLTRFITFSRCSCCLIIQN